MICGGKKQAAQKDSGRIDRTHHENHRYCKVKIRVWIWIIKILIRSHDKVVIAIKANDT